MTIDEYVQQIARELQELNDEQKVDSVLARAHNKLINDGISISSQKRFWDGLYELLGGESAILFDSQSTAALSAILTAAKQVILQKQAILQSKNAVNSKKP